MKSILNNQRGSAAIEIVIFIAVFLLLIPLAGAIFVQNMADEGKLSYELEEISEEEIYSIKDNNSVSGELVWGTGSIESGFKYNYMIKNEKGGYKQKNVPVDESTIYNSEEQPKIITYKKDYGFWEFLIDKQYEYEIYIPEGAVDESFKVDME